MGSGSLGQGLTSVLEEIETPSHMPGYVFDYMTSDFMQTY